MRLFGTFAALGCIWLLSGCATHESESRAMRAHWNVGDFSTAKKEAQTFAADYENSGDAIIWLLESGAAARAANDIDASIAAFQKAYEKMRVYEERPEVSFTDETGAILTNQSYLPYRGYHYDKIMLCAYQAMNQMEKRNFGESAVWLRRLQNYQENAARANADRIAAEADELKKANEGKNSYDTEKALKDAKFSAQLKQIYGDAYMPSAEVGARGVYVNPFGYWLSGVYFLNAAEAPGDINMAADFLRFALESSGGTSNAILEDIKVAEKLAGGGLSKPDPATYIIYEAGSAPIRRQTRIDIPLFVVVNEVPYVGAAFPYLEMQPSYGASIGSGLGFDTIADMDGVIKREFDTELPLVISKTLISTGVKAGIQYGLYQAARASDNDAAKIISLIVGVAYQTAMNDADLRTWTTLPKQIKIARMQTPSTGLLVLESQSLRVDPQKTNIIFAKRTGAGTPLSARVFTFN